MRDIGQGTVELAAVVAWIAGAVLAPGWWKVAAVFGPPYAWYLLIERVMQAMGLAP